jgi:hypothetical protein
MLPRKILNLTFQLSRLTALYQEEYIFYDLPNRGVCANFNDPWPRLTLLNAIVSITSNRHDIMGQQNAPFFGRSLQYSGIILAR